MSDALSVKGDALSVISTRMLLIFVGVISLLVSGCFRQVANVDPIRRQQILSERAQDSTDKISMRRKEIPNPIGPKNPKPQSDSFSSLSIEPKSEPTKYAAMRVSYHDHTNELTFADHQPQVFESEKQNDIANLLTAQSNETPTLQANPNAIDFEIFNAKSSENGSTSELTLPADRNLLETLISDQREFYSGKSLRPMLYALGASAVLSSTEMDHNFSDWYQSDVRNSGFDGVSKYAKHFGEHWQMVGIYFSSSLIGRIQGRESVLATWGDRSVRSTLVGFPSLLVLQKAIGSTRPNDIPPSSRWNFNGDDNGASGHTFIGAVPFLVAAQMTDERIPKATLMALSTVPGWSRINDDHHYLSQVIVGWCLAYIATESIHRTELKLGFEIEPMFAPDRQGLNFIWQR